MKKYYFTFGQAHVHSVNGKTFDKDCVVEIEAEDAMKAREIMLETFGQVWAFQYDSLEAVDMSFYKRGIMKI